VIPSGIAYSRNIVLAVCRSQRALLKVLSKVDNKPCQTDDSIRLSTAWTDDTECHRVGQSVSCTSLAYSSGGIDTRNSISAENLTAMKQSLSGDTDRKSDTVRTQVKCSGHSQSPATSGKCSTDTAVRSSHRDSEAVRQSGSGRSQRRSITVDIELLSNWGHERSVGLTEIELFDASERRIDIHPSSDVTVSAASPVNPVDALFNRKCKV